MNPTIKIPKYNRGFARSEWRKSFAPGTFRYRGLMPGCPHFQYFIRAAKKA